MPSLEIVNTRVGLGISIFNKYPDNSYGKANVGNAIQVVILIYDALLFLFSYLALCCFSKCDPGSPTSKSSGVFG